MIASLVLDALKTVDPNMELYLTDDSGLPQHVGALVHLSFSEVTATGVTRHQGIGLLTDKQVMNLRPVPQAEGL